MTNRADSIKDRFGDEYPAAVTVRGVRMTLKRESDFSRTFEAHDRKQTFCVSRFMDGSASITFAELEAAWPDWSTDKRIDFCGSCNWLNGQDDFPSILRFVMSQDDPINVSQVANSVGSYLPQEEAFLLLCSALKNPGEAGTANITQAIAKTKHPLAQQELLTHLRSLWSAPDLWDDDPFINDRAFDVTCCIAHLLTLGTPAVDFEEQVRHLVAHPCKRNRDSCSFQLYEYYEWLPPRDLRKFEGG